MARKCPIVVVCLGVLFMFATPVVSLAETALSGLSKRSAQSAAPKISGNTDGRTAWMTAVYRDLLVRTIANRTERTVSIDLRYQFDAVTITIDTSRVVSVTRSGRTVAVTSPEALQDVQRLLSGSDALFAVRSLFSERERVSELDAPEMSLLATAAFVASLAGDVDAPRRLSTRFVEKHRGIYRAVREESCWDKYKEDTTNAWGTLQSCMDEANQDESILNAAYRRLACNTIWILESESAWFEYLNCLSPLSIAK